MDLPELHRIVANIHQELTNAKGGVASSFPFIHNPLPKSDAPKADETIQVLVIGGTVFRNGLFQRQNGKLHLISSSEKSQPAFHTKDEFLNFCLSEIDPGVTKIGVNFAYPLTPITRQNRLDGVLVTGMKEHRFEGLVGQQVGATIEAFIQAKTGKAIQIYLTNDTICLLLSGLSIAPSDTLAAGVIGTGINMAFFSSPAEAINTEAANFNKFILSEEARAIDAQSAAPGKALMEKEIAGGYLFLHYNEYLRRHTLPYSLIDSTEELDRLAQEKTERGDIARRFLERSAQLTATLIAGIASFKESDLTFIIEGSLSSKNDYARNTTKSTSPVRVRKYGDNRNLSKTFFNDLT